MSTGFPVLSFVTFFPLIGVLIIAALNPEAKRNARWTWACLLTGYPSPPSN